MKLAKEKFDGAVIGYATSELYPALGEGWKTWVFAGGLPLMLPQAHAMMVQLGLEDKDGVNIDALEVFIKNAFKAQPKLDIPALGMGFDKSDGEKLLARLKNSNNTNTNIF